MVVEDTSVPKRPSVEPKSELGYRLRSDCVDICRGIISVICDYGFCTFTVVAQLDISISLYYYQSIS